MDTQTLERLLIDQHLGELPEDVASLLEAYLGKDPSAARSAGQIGETMALARATLRSQPNRALPRLRYCRPSPWREYLNGMKLPVVQCATACVLGLLAGWWIANFPYSSTPTPRASVVSAQLPEAQVAQSLAAHDSFWSKARWAARYAAMEKAPVRSNPLPLFKNPPAKDSL